MVTRVAGCLRLSYTSYSTVQDLFCLHVAQLTVAVVGRLSGL